MGILKKFRLTDMSYFSSRHGVPGVPASLYWRMGGSVGGSVGRPFIFLFYLFLENYLIYDANFVYAP